MADWADTALDGSTVYTAIWDRVRGRQKDALTQLNAGSYSNLPVNAIRWDSANSKWLIWDGSAWADLAATFSINVQSVGGKTPGNSSGNLAINNGTKCVNLNADMLDGLHAGNSSGQVPINNGTVCTNLNADKVDGYNAGNSSGQVPVSNGTVCTNLNADMLDGKHAGNSSGAIPINNGTLCTNLNADKLDGKHANEISVLRVASAEGNTHTDQSGVFQAVTFTDIYDPNNIVQSGNIVVPANVSIMRLDFQINEYLVPTLVEARINCVLRLLKNGTQVGLEGFQSHFLDTSEVTTRNRMWIHGWVPVTPGDIFTVEAKMDVSLGSFSTSSYMQPDMCVTFQ